MLTRLITTILAFTALAALTPVATLAAERTPFTQEALSAAQQAGKSVLVNVHASWCPTCKAQKAAIEELGAKAEFKDIVVLEIDFDKQKDEWKALGAQARSTLIAFKGDKETGRLVGDTKKESIEALLKGAL